jgi:phosphate butyryltransferase
MVTTLDQMTDRVLATGRKHRIAVAWAQDPNTIHAVSEAVRAGFAEAFLIGNPDEIGKTCKSSGIDSSLFTIIGSENGQSASVRAVAMVRSGEADIIMKGLVGTDVFLKAVMDRQTGIMLPDAVLTYVGALEIPAYHKLLFITDPAVIPFPDLRQKTSMIRYAVEMTEKFGIADPKIALIGASEKMSRHFPSNADDAELVQMAARGELGACVVDGPVDLFLACDPESLKIKGVDTPLEGDSDVLLFPSLEASNPFYKGLMLFAGGEIAGLIRGTSKPVVLMSRNESEKSKFYCIALACLLA